MTRTILAAFAVSLATTAALAYDYTADLHRDCAEWGLNQRGMFGAPLCEAVEVTPLTRAEATAKGLMYRAVGWGKKFPADEDGYFLPSSGEFIPRSWALPSPDNAFHRCTYPLNEYWSGTEWKVRRDNGTADGKPHTRCFWRPASTSDK